MTAKKPVRRPARKKVISSRTIERTPQATGYGIVMFGLIEKQLKSASKRPAYVPPEKIARALRKNPGIPIPAAIHDYLCDFLEGKIKAPAGRPSDLRSPAKILRTAFIQSTYERNLAWLQKRKRSKGLNGWKPIQNADWWQGAPNERAARMTSRRLGYSMDWRRVKNIVSKAKK